MLVSKFSVPIIHHSCFENLKYLLVRYASKKTCNKVIKENLKSEGKIEINERNRCDENRAALAKCPKKEKTCKTDKPKCNSRISDVYLQSLRSVEENAKKLSNFVENSTNLIIKSYEKEVNHKKTEQAAKRKKFLKIINDKLQELIKLDGFCGIKKRNQAWMINYKVFDELKYCNCEKPKDIKFLQNEKEKLISETKLTTNSAIDLIKICRKCETPNSLKDCVEENTKKAIEILEESNEKVLEEIDELKNYKIKAVKNFSDSLESVTESYTTKIEDFSKNLSRSITFIKKQKKMIRILRKKLEKENKMKK
ncbi:uncharacterized protein LOC122509348 [Leptopilina heterotoma]|uniref:uncharacterized protein LOC122509348 n=1 Tax=Leptopilina heterotoma TaxID=63436 RepID=UPI001CA8715B|nr:uncharacterized protein LOC122509348 [Leptopilina heterotoma]